METKATLRGVRLSAQKGRLVADLVRGKPVDHPHGGGEGKTAAGRDPCSPWGVPTKGYRTRSNKRTSNMIVQRRHKR